MIDKILVIAILSTLSLMGIVIGYFYIRNRHLNYLLKAEQVKTEYYEGVLQDGTI